MNKNGVTRSKSIVYLTKNTETVKQQINQSSSLGADGSNASLEMILDEVRDFRCNNKQQLAHIKQELTMTNRRLDEAEGPIDEN